MRLATGALAPGQLLLQRQQIPPSQFLLQRLPQKVSRVERRHRCDLLGAGVVASPLAAEAQDSFVGGEHRLRRSAAEEDEDFRIDQLYLPPDEGAADLLLLRAWIAIARRAPGDDVRDVGAGAVE